MIEALIDGERRGQVLADLARGRLRAAGKRADLSMALAGRFTGHHALLCRLHLDRIEAFNAAVAGLQAQITVRAAPWQREQDLLISFPGFGQAVAQAWLAEIGPAPHKWFSSHAKLASWVTLCPGNHVSAGKRKRGRTVRRPRQPREPPEQLIIQAARRAPRGQHIRGGRPLPGLGLGDHRPVKPQPGRQRVLAAEPSRHPRPAQLTAQERTRVGLRVPSGHRGEPPGRGWLIVANAAAT